MSKGEGNLSEDPQFIYADDLEVGNGISAYLANDRRWLDIQLTDEIAGTADSIAFTVDQARALRDWLVQVCPP